MKHEAIKAGHVFDTAHETDCIAATDSDAAGNFDAWDSDNVLCSFNIQMVTRVGEKVTEV